MGCWQLHWLGYADLEPSTGHLPPPTTSPLSLEKGWRCQRARLFSHSIPQQLLLSDQTLSVLSNEMEK